MPLVVLGGGPGGYPAAFAAADSGHEVIVVDGGSTDSTAAADNLVEGVDLLLEQNFGPEQSFLQAVEADEGFALAYAGLAYFYMAGGKIADARKAAQQAQSLEAGITRREQQQIEAMALWVNGRGPESLAVIQQHIAEFGRFLSCNLPLQIEAKNEHAFFALAEKDCRAKTMSAHRIFGNLLSTDNYLPSK